MRAFASSFGAWESLEEQEGIKVPHGLVFPLAAVEALGAPHGLEMDAEEHTPEGPAGHDAVFVTVLDSRTMINAATHFRRWGMPFRSKDRKIGEWPLVWAGGSGLHNPMPLAPVADLIVIGDAEDPLPILLDLWHTHGNSQRFLTEAAAVESVFVPSIHDTSTDRIVQGVAEDISVTFWNVISVSHDGTIRLEIARGCPFACTFCILGHRTPYREMSAEKIIERILTAPDGIRFHLQAGDAESHSGITEIRAALGERGGTDTGWTGRVDTFLENPDQTVAGNERYAFGVEATSAALRSAVGKGNLTHVRLVRQTLQFMDALEPGTVGRTAWHMMVGLPGEKRADILEFIRLVEDINEARAGMQPKNLSLHWQPFSPLPGTPMQWHPAGSGVRRTVQHLRGLEKLPWLRVKHVTGRTDRMAGLCSVLGRADKRGADLLEAYAANPGLSIAEAEAVSGSTAGEIPRDAALPWDFVIPGHKRGEKESLVKSFEGYHRRLERMRGGERRSIPVAAG